MFLFLTLIDIHLGDVYLRSAFTSVRRFYFLLISYTSLRHLLSYRHLKDVCKMFMNVCKTAFF